MTTEDASVPTNDIPTESYTFGVVAEIEPEQDAIALESTDLSLKKQKQDAIASESTDPSLKKQKKKKHKTDNTGVIKKPKVPAPSLQFQTTPDGFAVPLPREPSSKTHERERKTTVPLNSKKHNKKVSNAEALPDMDVVIDNFINNSSGVFAEALAVLLKWPLYDELHLIHKWSLLKKLWSMKQFSPIQDGYCKELLTTTNDSWIIVNAQTYAGAENPAEIAVTEMTLHIPPHHISMFEKSLFAEGSELLWACMNTDAWSKFKTGRLEFMPEIHVPEPCECKTQHKLERHTPLIFHSSL